MRPASSGTVTAIPRAPNFATSASSASDVATLPDAFEDAIEKLGAKLQGWLDSAVAMAPNFVLAVLVVIVAGYAARYAGRGATRGLARATKNKALASLVGSTAKVAVVIAGVFVALSLLHLEKTVTSLLAGLGVAGLALGFAFKDIAANFMSGALLAVRGPFEAGDIIEIDGKVGQVQALHLRRTVLRTFDGLTLIMPNKAIFQTTITNYTRTNERRVDVEVGVAYGDDLELAREVLCAALTKIEGRDESRDIEVLFTGFGDSSINLVVLMWLPDAHQLAYLRARSEMVMRIKAAIEGADLTIPFPIRTLDFGADAIGGQRELGVVLSEGRVGSPAAAG